MTNKPPAGRIYSKPEDHLPRIGAAAGRSTDLHNARAGDPDTSYEAARKAAMGASRVRPVILELVQKYGPLTQAELVRRYQGQIIMDPDTPRASDSGIRTRLRELVRADLVVRDDVDGLSDYGNAARRWIALTPAIVAAKQAAIEAATTITPDADGLADDQDELAELTMTTP